MLGGRVRVGDYHYFTIHDPKERTICAAHFRERVLHHAVMNVCEPVLERAAVFDSYACRKGKGQLAANFYLAPLDRFIKEHLCREAYVRYMDDFVVWGDSSGELGEVRRQIEAFLASELHLALKPSASLNRTAFGMDFLGYRILPHQLRLARRSKLRFTHKFRRYEEEWMAGRWTELELQQRMQALVAFTLPACSRSWRRHVLDRFGVMANGLEPRDSRRQLEQLERLGQSQELPVSEPQQQQPG